MVVMTPWIVTTWSFRSGTKSALASTLMLAMVGIAAWFSHWAF